LYAVHATPFLDRFALSAGDELPCNGDILFQVDAGPMHLWIGGARKDDAMAIDERNGRPDGNSDSGKNC